MKKKFLAMILACLMVFLMLPTTVFAAEFNDTEDHWGKEAIDRWGGYEVVQGKGDGVFDPEGIMTRGEAAQVFANLLKLIEMADLSEFTDVGLGKWYDDAIAKCYKAGIMKGIGDGKMDPTGIITREMFFVMFARVLGVEPVEKAEVAVSDSDEISDWASGYITALVNKGYVNGVPSTDDGVKVAPKLDINRASVMSLMDKTIAVYVNTTEKVVAGDGLVLIVVDNANVSLKDSTGKAEVYVFGKNVAISNAPAGTTVITSDASTGVKVNNKTLSKDTATVIEETPAPSTPVIPYIPYSPSHTHSYENNTATCTTDGVETCSCGEKQPMKATGHKWDADGKCTNTGCTETKETAMKFSLAVTSGATVDMTVFDDYSFIINVPNANVNAASATAAVKMQNVDSLGVGEKREHSITVSTGIEEHDSIALGTYLSNAWTLSQETTTVNINIDGKECAYEITGNNAKVNDATGEAVEGYEKNVVLSGKPKDIEATRAAWQALTANVETSTGEDDSRIVIANGSYLQNGTEMLKFENGYTDNLTLDNFDNLDALKTTIKNAVVLDTEAEDSNNITGVLKAGTELKVSSSKATLTKDATITVNTTVDGALAKIRTASEGSTTALLKELVDQINAVMGTAAGKTINVGITFTTDN